jgi:hypothetical protein
MGVDDDGPYILMARTLAATGRLVYNGWPAAMIGWQLYLGAAFIKLFGFSYTTVRMSTVLVAMVLAFILHRTLVLAGITERNATLGTLALVLSPLYLVLSATFMSDITGLLAVVICLYACLRALHSPTQRSTILWLCFAVLANAICGTSRQISWLGILILVPSTLWLLRANRRVLLAGSAATLAGIVFIFACLQWLKHQPYVQPERLLPETFPVLHILGQLSNLLLDVPFLLLPLFALFLPAIRRNRPRVVAVLAVAFFGYFFLASYPSHLRGRLLLEPTIGWQAGWVGAHGIFEGVSLRGKVPIFLSRGVQVLLTLISFGGLAGLFTLIFVRRPAPPPATIRQTTARTTPTLPWKHLSILLAPFTLLYLLLLVPRASGWLFDRYLLPLLAIALLALVRYYQDRISLRLPLATLGLLAIMAAWGIALTHNTFSLYRARVALAAELRANGIPDTSVDNGWEYNLDVELQHAPTINYPTLVVPAHAYIHVPPPPPGLCPMDRYDFTPHIHALYGISFQQDDCYGPAPFVPVHYSRWPYRTPGTLYVVRYLPLSKSQARHPLPF